MPSVDVVVTIGRRIRQLRDEAGLSQEQLAELAEISRVNLSRIERGLAEAKIRQLARIARGLGTNLSGLFDGVDRL